MCIYMDIKVAAVMEAACVFFAFSSCPLDGMRTERESPAGCCTLPPTLLMEGSSNNTTLCTPLVKLYILCRVPTYSPCVVCSDKASSWQIFHIQHQGTE